MMMLGLTTVFLMKQIWGNPSIGCLLFGSAPYKVASLIGAVRSLPKLSHVILGVKYTKPESEKNSQSLLNNQLRFIYQFIVVFLAWV
jgi:hypothetical protein